MAKILVIDDDEFIRVLFREILETAGHEVTDASNGQEGITLQRAHSFDLIITDIIMPEKEGIGTIIELLKEFPNLKIIAVSGGGKSGNINYLNQAKKLGAKKILLKPVDGMELLNTIHDCLTDPV